MKGEIIKGRECNMPDCAVCVMLLVDRRGETTLEIFWRAQKAPLCAACDKFVRSLDIEWPLPYAAMAELGSPRRVAK